jgi:NDP-sugar pyrophosphorylase family protein
MKAMVLAAGRGTRLRPLTDRIPKPMIPIGGRPLLEHVVRLLSHHGFDDLVINLSHLPDVIRDHFGAPWPTTSAAMTFSSTTPTT